MIIEFTHTDLPEPVVPAISRWGISAISAITMPPEISLPSTAASLLFFSAISLLSISCLNGTVSLILFGTSMPTAGLFGIGASILMPDEARLSAISSASPVILEILTPAAGCNSYLVTDGPLQVPIHFV